MRHVPKTAPHPQRGNIVTIIDNACQLRQAPDLWPFIEEHIPRAISDAKKTIGGAEWSLRTTDLEAKFRRGEAEHGRDWLDMSADQLEDEIRAELLDLVLYHAMVRARWTQPRFLSNRDPGDEDEIGVPV
jgi:hypothetical protein